METQGTRLGSLQETGEQLIKDADYHNSTAKGIRDQLDDFDGCWADITKSVKERKEMVSNKGRITVDLVVLSRYRQLELSGLKSQSMNLIHTINLKVEEIKGTRTEIGTPSTFLYHALPSPPLIPPLPPPNPPASTLKSVFVYCHLRHLCYHRFWFVCITLY